MQGREQLKQLIDDVRRTHTEAQAAKQRLLAAVPELDEELCESIAEGRLTLFAAEHVREV